MFRRLIDAELSVRLRGMFRLRIHQHAIVAKQHDIIGAVACDINHERHAWFELAGLAALKEA
jgi:hypothetical protein